MFKISYIFLISFLILSCSEESEMINPFYEDYKNEFQVPNFKSIKIDQKLQKLKNLSQKKATDINKRSY